MTLATFVALLGLFWATWPPHRKKQFALLNTVWAGESGQFNGKVCDTRAKVCGCNGRSVNARTSHDFP